MAEDPTLAAPGATPGEERAPTRLPERYDDLGPIAAGSFGEVRRVRDRALDRTVAMKILRGAYRDVEAARARFADETRVTAGLQHPGIVPVHDFGVLDDGRPWFTMPEVSGRTLHAIVDDVHGVSAEAWGTTSDGWSLRRLVGALEAIGQAVAYAHARGVVHRDLKPSNVVVGAFGEVLVLDWGLARVRADGLAGLARTAGGTVDGATLGTPGYMAPEQRRGQTGRHGPASDVYALGAMLHHVLVGAPPGRAIAVRLPEPPEQLVRLAAAALREEPEVRPSAAELASEARAWLEGRRRRDEALRLVDAVAPLRSEASEARDRARRRMIEAAAALAEVRPSDPADRKAAGWQLEDSAREDLDRAEVLEARYAEGLRAALNAEPELAEAHDGLAELLRERLLRAEAEGRPQDAARAEIELRAHARGDHLAWLDEPPRLTLVTDPPGTARLWRWVERERRRAPEGGEPLGDTPLFAVAVPRGPSLVVVEAPGRAPLRYPIAVERSGHWDGVPPGEGEPAPIVWPDATDDEGWVPAGWFRYGGDPEAPDALPPGRAWVDGFVIQRAPVTNAAFAAFLDAVDDPRFVPVEQAGVGGGHRRFEKRGGRWVPGVGADGVALHPEAPVTCVDVASARAYAAWRASTDGLPWRLPCSLEWEKAARGVDERRFPWGDFFDPAFARMQHSVAGAPSVATVHEHPLDESPYGIRGLGGNVRDWCDDAYRRGPPDDPRVRPIPAPSDATWHVIRGGAWSSGPAFCRAAGRLVAEPTARLTSLGFRLTRSVR